MKGCFGRLYVLKKTRPFTFNPNTLMADRLSQGERYSFFPGIFPIQLPFVFTAHMVNSYVQSPAWKVVAWGGAAGISGIIRYWPYTSAKHYPSDILAGYLLGAGTGYANSLSPRWQLRDNVSFHFRSLSSGILNLFILKQNNETYIPLWRYLRSFPA